MQCIEQRVQGKDLQEQSVKEGRYKNGKDRSRRYFYCDR